MRVSDGVTSLDNFDCAHANKLLPNFRMPKIKRYTGKGCPCILLRLYTIVMRADRLDEP